MTSSKGVTKWMAPQSVNTAHSHSVLTHALTHSLKATSLCCCCCRRRSALRRSTSLAVLLCCRCVAVSFRFSMTWCVCVCRSGVDASPSLLVLWVVRCVHGDCGWVTFRGVGVARELCLWCCARAVFVLVSGVTRKRRCREQTVGP